MTKEEIVTKVILRNPTLPTPQLATKIVGALELFEDLFGTQQYTPVLGDQSLMCQERSPIIGQGQGPEAALAFGEAVEKQVVEIRKAKKKQEPEAPKQFLAEPRDLDEMFDEFQQEFPTVMELKVFPTKPSMEVCCYVGKLLNSQTYIDKDGKGKSGITLRIVKKSQGSEDVVLFPDRFIFSEENLSAKDVKEEATKMIREQLTRGFKEIPVRVLPVNRSIPDDLSKWSGGNAVE